MSRAILQRGSVVRETEFETRGINQDGDAVDVDHYDSAPEAIARGAEMLGTDDGLGGRISAWVVERHVSYHPAHLAPRGREPDEYTTIDSGGDVAALRAGGWIS